MSERTRMYTKGPPASQPKSFRWVSVADRVPESLYTIVLWITGGDLHHGEDYMDVSCYKPDRNVFSVGNGGEDIDVPVSHWMEVEEPAKAVQA